MEDIIKKIDKLKDKVEYQLISDIIKEPYWYRKVNIDQFLKILKIIGIKKEEALKLYKILIIGEYNG